MNYSNIEKYAEKIGISRTNRRDQFFGYEGARFELTPYGENYFFNTKIHIDALLFSFHYSAGAANYHELHKQAEKIRKYAARYGFAIFTEGHNITGFWFVLMTKEEKQQIKTMLFFEDGCREECEILIHNYHLFGIHNTLHAQLENTLKETMLRWERLYLEYIKNKEEKTDPETINNVLYFVA